LGAPDGASVAVSRCYLILVIRVPM